MSKTFTAFDASKLEDSWYRQFFGSITTTPISDAFIQEVKRKALAEFEDYRDDYKTFQEWCDLVLVAATDAEADMSERKDKANG